MTASSFGVGEVLRAVLDAGARQVILAVGGSARTDGGAGLLHCTTSGFPASHATTRIVTASRPP